MLARRMAVGFVGIAVSASLGVSAEAGNNRSVVSTTGLDTNNCSVPAPCRSFAAALAHTNPNGEIIVLDSGGYGPASITQPVKIIAPAGVRASVFTATAITGFTINTTGNVTIEGIGFLGGGVGTAGIFCDNIGTLSLDRVEIEDFTEEGISFSVPGGNLFVSNSVVRNSVFGLVIFQGSAYVSGSAFLNNSDDGVQVQANGHAVLVDSVASFNGGNGANAAGGIVDLQNFRGVLNGAAGIANAATVRFESSLSTQNQTPFSNTGSMSGSNPGTSALVGSGSGTLQGPTGLQ